ncbi:uncharacterized protein TNCV_4660521 [Trichonephila clavipes]|uniref:Uncharacterized protein n=1 Tax=Trichonephila clavipes TaxID=2585209 RepID=A0A8X6VIT8_TRICX|nr:uncharacterized protein TNCV_4660521 [Trichonephila clavipes]
MSSSKVRKWVRAFKDGRENVHDEPRFGRPSVITDDLVNAVDEKIREDRRFTMAAVAEWYRYRIVACLVTSSIPVPQKDPPCRAAMHVKSVELKRPPVGVVW